MPYDARSVANFLLDHADQVARPITHLSLQKIIYFCHGWHLALHGKPLIEEPVEAWSHGPVYKSVYKAFKPAKRQHINFRATRMNFREGKEEVVTYDFESDIKQFLANIFNVYAQFSANDLRQISHVDGGPWHQIWSEALNKPSVGMRIPNDLILEHFRKDPQGLIVQ